MRSKLLTAGVPLGLSEHGDVSVQAHLMEFRLFRKKPPEHPILPRQVSNFLFIEKCDNHPSDDDSKKDSTNHFHHLLTLSAAFCA